MTRKVKDKPGSLEKPILPLVERAGVRDNLTGGQTQEILDGLMLRSITPIVLNSDVFDIQVAHVLSKIARNKKRKLSALPREEVISQLCKFLVGRPEQKVDILTGAKLERGFLYKFVVNFIKEAATYRNMYSRYLVCHGPQKEALSLKLKLIETSLRCNRDKLWVTLEQCSDYLELMYEFRNAIVMNYYKFAYQQAGMFVKQKGENFNFDDVYQNFLAAITKAIDKYDASKGAFTSYIKWWVLNAQTANNNGHEYGIAYSIPQVQKKTLGKRSTTQQVNFSVSLNSLVGDSEGSTELHQHLVGYESVEHDLERRQEIDHTRYLIKSADIKGLARLSLEVDEFISEKEKRKMRDTMKEQGTDQGEVA